MHISFSYIWWASWPILKQTHIYHTPEKTLTRSLLYFHLLGTSTPVISYVNKRRGDLVIQQKRFCSEKGIMSKDSSTVDCFPQDLTLSVGREDSLKQSVSYELIAIINHKGFLTAGHYGCEQEIEQYLFLHSFL